MQREYELAFHQFKPDKRLRWYQHLGTAEVKLELSDRVIQVEATPIQAAVSELYESQDRWTVEALAGKLGIGDRGAVRNALLFWAGLGVVKEEKEGWRLLEIAEEGAVNQSLPGASHSHQRMGLSVLTTQHSWKRFRPFGASTSLGQSRSACTGTTSKASTRCFESR